MSALPSTSASRVPTGRPRSRWRRRLLALLVSTLLAFLGAELVVRWKVGAPLVERLPMLRVRANEFRGYEMMPGETHYTYQQRVQVNSHGLRGEEIPREKDERELRVLCLGDSLVYGQGVSDEETLPAQLERVLQAREPSWRWRVINGGLRAYATHQELGLLRELGDEIRPDWTVLCWFSNDLNERPIAATYAMLSESGPVVFDTNAVEMEGAPLWRWRALQFLRRSALGMYLWDFYKAQRPYFPPRAIWESGIERFENHLRYLSLRSEHRLRSAVIVAVIPDASQVEGPHESRELGEMALAAVRSHGLTAVDLLPGLRSAYERTGRRETLPFDGHPTGAAYAVMAESIAAAILP